MSWKTCPTHGPDKPEAWGCPECVRELREERQRLEPVLQFLRGAAPLEGVWFGEDHPTERGHFWWRKRLPPSTPL
jgi:hypothetical protein